MCGTTQSLFFTTLYNQYAPGKLLIESKRGPEFRSPGWHFFRCLEASFMGTKFEIEKTAPSLLNKARNALKEKNLSLEELESLTKVLFIVKRIFRGLELIRDKKPQSFKDLFAEEKDLSLQALRQLAEKKKKSELELFLELSETHDFFIDDAHAQVRREKNFKKFSQHYLNLICNLGYKKADYDLFQKALAAGGAPPHINAEHQQALLYSALCQYNDAALTSLIKAGLKWDFSPSHDSKSFIFFCLEQGMTEAIKAMAATKIPFTMRDSKGNTPLHYAFMLGNIPLVRTLGKVIDPTTKNKRGQTPFVSALNPQGKTALNLAANNLNKEEFLKELFESTLRERSLSTYPSSNFARSIRTSLGTQEVPLIDFVELAFLVDSPEASRQLFPTISQEKLLRSCEILLKKYPKTAVERFILSSYSLNEGHFQTGLELIPLGDVVEGDPDPSELLKILDQERSFTRSERSSLASFIERVKTRATNTGSYPQGSAAHEDFCHQMEVNLKHTVYGLRQKNNSDLTRSTLKELIDALNHCAGRHYAAALKAAQMACLNIKTDPLSSLQRTLAEFRSLCLEDAVVQVYPDSHNVNSYTAALHHLGHELGIPGVPLRPFSDRCSPLFFNAPSVRTAFMNIYTPQAIVDHLLKKLKDDISFRNEYVDLLKTHVPEDWTVSGDEKDPSEDDKAYDFIEKSMYDEHNQFQISTIRYLLEKLGVIECKMAKESKEPSRGPRNRKSK